MAKVIQDERNIVTEPWWAKGTIVYVGLGAGLLWWVLTSLLRHYIVEPLACRDLSAATACVNSLEVSGNIAAILVAAVGVFALIRVLQPRPIIIAVATLAVLWGIGGFMAGLAWAPVFLWSLFFYAVAYSLFSLVARIATSWIAFTVAIVIVVGARLLPIL